VAVAPNLLPVSVTPQKGEDVTTQDLPLNAYPSFRANTVDRITDSVACELGASILEVAKPTMPVEARANRYKLPSGDLWFCSYGLPIKLRFPEGDDLRIQFRHTGAGVTRLGQNLAPVTADQSCIIASATAEVDFRSGFQQVAWRLPRAVLLQKLVALTGRAVTRKLEFDPVLEMTTPQSSALRKILECMLYTIDFAPSRPAKLMLRELESSLIVTLLAAAQHNYRNLLDVATLSAAPWQVYRAESYIEANWNQPITVEAIASVSGTSARSIFRAFKENRGYSPFEFVRKVRLENALRLLQCSDPAPTITEVALAWALRI
jgi:AraC-like DNA-binding protein